MWRMWLLVAAIVESSAAEGVMLRVGVGRADITPEVEVRNWVTGKPYGEVLDRLFVHALLLDDGATKAVVVRWDLVDVSESARDEVRRVVGAALAMPGEHIMVNASHTHSAPWAPVYKEGYRGKERESWWALRYMPSQDNHPPYQRWKDRLLAACVEAAKRAAETAKPASLAIGRVSVAEFLHNRRPRAPGWGLAEKSPAVINYNHPEWNPDVLQGGATFGPMDRTFALVQFRSTENKPIAALFHVACHAVSIYPSNPAISADWPGAAARTIAAALGGDALYLQGCAGDINPWRRGEGAVATMAGGFAAKAQVAARHSVKLALEPLRVGRTIVNLPLKPEGKQRLGQDTVATEIQAIVCGPLAIVGMAGEALTEIGLAIRDASPFPQTLVLAYTNGNGTHYVGMPHDRPRGGYEMTVGGVGTDECGPMMIEATTRLLREMFAQRGAK